MSGKLQRRSFVKLLSGTGGLFLSGLPFAGKALDSNKESNQQEEAISFRTKPYLQYPEADGITICWLVSKPAHSWVEYWEMSDKPAKGETVVAGLVAANNTVNKIRLQGLKPGTRYSYKVCSKEILLFEPYKKQFGATITSDVFSFTTPSPKQEEVSMLILNDIHDRPQSFASLEKLNGTDSYEMVFLNGDMFDHQDSEQQLIDHLIQPCCEVFASQKPFLFVRGNHETRGAFSYRLDEYFENIGKAPYFSFSRGPVFFIALDTGEDKEDNHEAYYGLAAFDAFRKQQAIWLDKQLQSEAANKALYKVVLMHIPPFHSGDWHGTMHCREVFTPVFEKYKVSMVISGHTHRYGVHEPQTGHSYPIIIGGGPKEGNRTLIKLKADKKQLTVKMIADNNQEVGSYIIKGK